jgi:phosphatidylinositol kinase/protein kinase (PI-3  family)
VLSISPSSGLVEVVPDSSSIDALKKGNGCLSLARHFENTFGAGSAAFDRAVSAYISSLAGYSVLSYLMNIKDRHNGNILLLRDGHIVHIDFGFFFSIAPGGITFESAPFKMTRDFHELIGANVMSNPRYRRVPCVCFCFHVCVPSWRGFSRVTCSYAKLVQMMTQGMISVRRHVPRIMTLVQVCDPPPPPTTPTR